MRVRISPSLPNALGLNTSMDKKRLREMAGLIEEAVGTPKDLLEAVHFLAGNTKSSADQKTAMDLMKKNFKGREITNAVIVLETIIELFADEVEDD
jgi:hypothetical protein